jgi:oligopeptide/dipeptide ABC transporter ATP-binding protein
MESPLLDVRNLRVRLPGPTGLVTIVDCVDFVVSPGQVFGIAGESGSGKTMSVLALIGLTPFGAQIDGSAVFDNRDLLTLEPREIRDVRGREIAMVFQDPMTSLHPMMTIGRQLTEHPRHHLKLSRRDAEVRAIELLHEVRIPDPARAMHAYPHQFSGGMRQRIAIAMALICGPRILIADEPTTALDVTVQAGILRLLNRLREQLNLSVILITHDLGVMSAIADQLSIVYAGRVVETGPTRDVLSHPRHPYTAGLLASLPRPEAVDDNPLVPITGSPPSPNLLPPGCAFHPRCPYALASCAKIQPKLLSVQDDQRRSLACSVDPLYRH